MIVEFIFENKGKNETSGLVEAGRVETMQKVFIYGFLWWAARATLTRWSKNNYLEYS